MIHSKDNGQLEMKIDDDGGLFIFCPVCRGVWQIGLNIVRQPAGGRPFVYNGAGINLDEVPPAKSKIRRSAYGKTAIAKELFPEAFK